MRISDWSSDVCSSDLRTSGKKGEESRYPYRLTLAKHRTLAVNGAAMSILGKIFTWWDGATVGTLLNSWSTGKKVGEDSLGNRYFRAKKGGRRWVIYNGSNDASRVQIGRASGRERGGQEV